MAIIDKSKEKKPGTFSGTDDAGDKITGSNFNDIIDAKGGNDQVAGGNGDDTVYGGSGDDILWGDSFSNSNSNDNGQDKLYGGIGNDQIHGGNGKDSLDGGTGNDTMYGDNGSDLLFGDCGADTLYGGNAGDSFKYVKTVDSAGAGGAWSSATGDWIKDFNGSEGDKLDFTDFPASQLSGAGGNDLTWSDTAGAHKIWSDGHFVYADTNGDNIADLVIKVEGVGEGNITGINHAPTDADDTNSVTEDVTITADGNLLTNANDPDGDDLDVTVTGAVGDLTELGFDVRVDGTYGSLFVNSETGAYHYELDHDLANGLAEGEEQDENFTYEVSDGHGGTNSSTLKITVTGTNDAPTDDDENAGVTEDTAGQIETDGNLLTNANDPDGDDLDVTVTGSVLDDDVAGFDVSVAGTYGTLYVNTETGAYHYVLDHDKADGLADGEEQDDAFTYQVSDGNGGTNDSTLTITVTGTNDAPVLTGDYEATVEEGNSVVITTDDLNFTDVDDVAAGVTFTVTDLVHGEIQIGGVAVTSFTGTQLAAGDVSFVHDGSEGPDASFKVSVEDGNEDGSTPTDQLFTLNVTPVDEGDSHVAITGTVQEGETLTAVFTDDDPDGPHQGAIHYQWQADGGDIGTDQDTYVLTSDEVGKEITVVVTYTDGQGFAEEIESAATGEVEGNGPPAGPPVNTGGGDPNDFDNLVGQTTSGYNPVIDGTGNGDNSLNGANGSNPEQDDIINGFGGGDNIDGKDGNDLLYGGAGNDTITGNNGNDTIYGQADSDGSLTGNGGNDTIYGGSGNDTITGSGDNDTLFGGSGNDTINGGGGNDMIMGGFGADQTTGGTGGAPGTNADHFIFRDAQDTGDTITDFTQAEGDKIEFVENLDGMSMANIQIDIVGTDSIVSVDKNLDTTIDLQFTVTGVTTLSSSDFIF